MRRTEPAVSYEPGVEEPVSQAVVSAVSEAEDVDELRLEPIYDSVDPDALDALFGGSGPGRPTNGPGHVAFEYGSRQVRVESDGTVRVY